MERTCQACGETFLQFDACELCPNCRKCESCSLNYSCKLDELIEDLRQLQADSMALTYQAKLKRHNLTSEAQNDMDKLQKKPHEGHK